MLSVLIDLKSGESITLKYWRGTTDDVNLDGIADACEIESGAESDCDGNGIPDSCDLANGSIDEDGDGILDACQIDGVVYEFSIQDQWGGGFVAELVIRNLGQDPIDGWSVSWDTGYSVTNAWNSILQTSGKITEVTNEVFNRVITPGESVTIGFQGSGTPSPPTRVLVNGSEAGTGP